jgi:all-trans-retinol 13,14-reductase
MIQSYKKKPKILEVYDAIFIGSGMGSLATAAILAKEGKKVLILEKHYTAGGFTHIFKRKGYEWDVGIHYVGEVQRPKSIIKQLFDYITDEKLQWADMGEVYDKIIIGDRSYDFVKGVQNFKDKMTSYFPEEEKAIYEYVDLVFKANKTSKSFYLNKSLPDFVNKLFGSILNKSFYTFSDKTTYEVLKSITSNEELIKVLTGQYGDYGLPPKESSFFMHATLVKHYFSGGSFPVGGSGQIIETITPIIEESGGIILINADVKTVLVENNKAIGVKMIDGKTFYADSIISGAGLITTYNHILPAKSVQKHNLTKNLQQVRPSVAHVSLYIGLEGTPKELQLPKTNYWIYPDKLDHDTLVSNYVKDINKPFPVVYISFPSAKDPDWTNRYPDKSTIDIITLLPYEIFEPWEGSKWMKRGEEYDALKESIATRLLEELYKQFPHLKGKVSYYELSSPLTTKHFVNYEKGEIYGLDHTPKRFRQHFLKPKTPIKNFYLTGQDIVTAGIGGALFSGVLTSAAITGKNILHKIMK